MNIYRKGDLYRFKEALIAAKKAPSNLFSLVSHFIDSEDGVEKLILRESGTTSDLVATASDMENIPVSFNEKLLFCLTDISESLRLMAGASIESEHEGEEESAKSKKRDVH